MRDLKLRQIFSNIFSISVEKVTDDLSYQSIKEWDSVAHMALIAALDEEYDIMIETDDVIDMSSFKKAKDILEKYGVNCDIV